MGFLFLLLLGAGFFYLARYSLDHINNERIAQLPAQAQSRARERRENTSRRYGRRLGSPKFHRSALRPFLPYGLLTLSPFVLTLIFTQEPVALVLMGGGSVFMAAVMLYYFNREARAAYNVERESDDYVSTAAAALDDFVVPEEWSRYL